MKKPRRSGMKCPNKPKRRKRKKSRPALKPSMLPKGIVDALQQHGCMSLLYDCPGEDEYGKEVTGGGCDEAQQEG